MRRGLTIVEVLVTIVVVGIGLMGAVMCLNSALLTNQRASRIAVATMAANQVINDIRSQRAAAYIAYMTDLDTDTPALGITISVSGTKTTITYPMPPMTMKDAQNNTLASNQVVLVNPQVTVVVDSFTDASYTSMTEKLNTVTVTVSWTGNAKQTESVVLSTVVSNRIA
jgi:prepilin-type N-terminal cleavage/methylation domain-containing protein